MLVRCGLDTRSIHLKCHDGEGYVMPRRKHPLEIFRESGKVLQDGGSASKKKKATGGSSPRKGGGLLAGLRSGLASKQRKADQASRSKRSTAPLPNGRGPGEFKITLTMNHVLLVLFVTVSLIIAGYFGGYYKGSGVKDDPGLSLERSRPELIGDSGKTVQQPDRPRDESGGSRTGGSAVIEKLGGTYAVQVASYSEGGRSSAESARDELIRRGYKNVVNYHYRKSKTCAIMVGSYDREDHPDLLRLWDRLRSINDFPGGDKSPFKTAWVTRHPQR